MNHYTEKELDVLVHPFVDIRHKMNVLCLLGQLLMENGSNTNNILRDMERAAVYMGIPRQFFHAHISYNTLMLNINDEGHSYTMFRKTTTHNVNMTTLSALSKLTWTALEEQYSLEEFEERLHAIASMPRKYSSNFLALAAGFACGGFCILFGGSILSAWITTFCALMGFYVRIWCTKLDFNVYMTILLTAFAATTLAYTSGYLFGSSAMIYALITCTLFMIPGVPLINAIDDLLNSHIVAGITRAVNTVLVVGSMSVGIAMALYFDVVSNFTDVSILPHGVYILQLFAAFIGSAGFAIIFNSPYRLLPIIGIGGTISVLIRNSLMVDFHFTLMGAVFLAATAISILSLKVAPRLRTASLVLIIPSILPLIPGVLLYRCFLAMIKISTLTPETFLVAIQNGITGMLTIVSIAIGVAIPNIFAQKYLDREKHLKLASFLNARRGIKR